MSKLKNVLELTVENLSDARSCIDTVMCELQSIKNNKDTTVMIEKLEAALALIEDCECGAEILLEENE